MVISYFSDYLGHSHLLKKKLFALCKKTNFTQVFVMLKKNSPIKPSLFSFSCPGIAKGHKYPVLASPVGSVCFTVPLLTCNRPFTPLVMAKW